MTGIRLEQVGKTYPGGVAALKDVSLEIGAGEFMVLVGPSGCGKSTLLRLIAGLEEVTTGTIVIGDRDVTEVPPRERDIAMVFQNYALYPHMTVRRNLGYGLRVRRTPKPVIERRVEEVARMLGLSELLDRKPGALSGGQRQRVAMGRAIVREPVAFLMDEPLSNLDAKLRVGMRSELSRLHARLGTTTVFVTHDQIEAMTLGQRVTVMKDGVVQQIGRPQQLYRYPDNVFVGAFMGSPSMNLVRAVVSGASVEFGGSTLPLSADRRPVRDGPVTLGIRPTALADADSAPPDLPTLDVEAALTEELGATNHVLFWVDSSRIDPDVAGAVELEAARLLAEDERCLFTAVVEPALAPDPGERVRLAVRTSELYFFDHETGASLLAAKDVDRAARSEAESTSRL